MYTIEYYSAIKKNKILPFVATWMDLEGIMLSLRKTNTLWYHLHMEYKKYSKLVNIIKKQTDRYRELIVANGETEEERDKIGAGD